MIYAKHDFILFEKIVSYSYWKNHHGFVNKEIHLVDR